MSKNKGMWMAIALILVVGTGITMSTRKFITRQESAMTAETGAGDKPSLTAQEGDEAGAAEPDTGPAVMRSQISVQKQAEDAVPEPAPPGAEPAEGGEPSLQPAAEAAPAQELEEAVLWQDSDMQKAAAGESETVRSPLEAEPQNGNLREVEENVASGSYMDRLAELDAKVKRMREESGDSTTYGLKAIVEKELLLWDTELNAVYKVIMDNLDGEESGRLKKSEQDWMKKRDADASAAAGKYSGGTLESVEYTASLAASTRQRVYDLAEEYQKILEKGK